MHMSSFKHRGPELLTRVAAQLHKPQRLALGIAFARMCGTRGQDPTPLLPGPIGAESVHAAQGPRTGDVIRQGGRREAGRREEGGHASAQSRLAFFSADCTHNEALCAWLTIGVGVAWQDANADQGIDFTTWTFPAY